jgi:uncharacterized membrane protein
MKGAKSRMLSWLESLRFPWLLLITLVLFGINVLVPDAFPLIDEILLALIAVILSRLKRKPEAEGEGAPKEPPPG